MWIYLNNSFLSIVRSQFNPELLHVRARKEGDIEAIFPEADVLATPTGDYKFRTELRPSRVAEVMLERVMAIDYTNFKNSVEDHQRHNAYMATWSAAHGLEKRDILNQEIDPFGDESAAGLGW